MNVGLISQGFFWKWSINYSTTAPGISNTELLRCGVSVPEKGTQRQVSICSGDSYTASLFRLTTLSTSCFSDTISPQEPYYLSTLQDVILVYTEGIMVGLIEQKITCILDTGMSDVTGGTYENTISEHPVYVKEFIKRKSSFAPCTPYY